MHRRPRAAGSGAREKANCLLAYTSLRQVFSSVSIIAYVHVCFTLIPLSDRSDTQPTQARWEALPPQGEKRQVLGGAKVGGGAWGLAWVDTTMEVPETIEDRWAQERAPYQDLVSLPS